MREAEKLCRRNIFRTQSNLGFRFPAPSYQMPSIDGVSIPTSSLGNALLPQSACKTWRQLRGLSKASYDAYRSKRTVCLEIRYSQTCKDSTTSANQPPIRCGSEEDSIPAKAPWSTQWLCLEVWNLHADPTPLAVFECCHLNWTRSQSHMYSRLRTGSKGRYVCKPASPSACNARRSGSNVLETSVLELTGLHRHPLVPMAS